MENDFRNRIRKTKKLSFFLKEMKDDELFGQIADETAGLIASIPIREEETVFQGTEAILIAGYPGLSGSSLLPYYYGEELARQLPAHFLRQTMEWQERTKEDLEKLKKMKEGLAESTCYFLGEGGLNRSLYQLGKDSNKGFHIHYQSVPTRQEAVEICEFYDKDPWSMFSSGCMLIITEEMNKVMRLARENGIICNRVGYMTKDRDKLICHKTVNSRINRPEPDALLQILQEKLEEIR